MEVVVMTGAVRHAKLQSKCHQQQTNAQLFTGRIPFLSFSQQRQNTEGKMTMTEYLYNYKTNISNSKIVT